MWVICSNKSQAFMTVVKVLKILLKKDLRLCLLMSRLTSSNEMPMLVCMLLLQVGVFSFFM